MFAALDSNIEAALIAGLLMVLGGIAHLLLRIGRLEGKVDTILASLDH
jgi:hypothetical protein